MRLLQRLARPGWFDSSVTHQSLRDWQIGICTRLLSETKWVRIPHPAPRATKRRHSITDQCSELLPRTMRVQISLPLPMWGCGPTDEGARLRTLRSEFNSLHPLHISLGSRGLRHDDASVLTKRSGLDSRRELQGVGSVTEQHGSVRSCKSGFDSRPAHHSWVLMDS